MRCDEVRDKLHERPRLGVRLHLLRCATCRREAQQIARLDAALTDLPRFEPAPALLARVLNVADGPVVETRKERTDMRRLAYVVGVMVVLAVAAAVFVPGRGRKQDARGLLLSAVHAMELADSIHLSGYGSAPDKGSAVGIQMQPDRFDIWVSGRAFAVRQTDPSGKLLGASGLSLDTNELWDYGSDSGVRHVADVRPSADKAAEMINGAMRVLVTDNLRAVIESGLADVTESVSTETRGGRQVEVATYRGTFATSPRRITYRYVFELDPDTNRIISMHQYAQAEGSPEELVAYLDQVEYGVPVPTNLAPADAKTVPAELVVEDTERALSLIMKVDGKEVSRAEAPHPKRRQ